MEGIKQTRKGKKRNSMIFVESDCRCEPLTCHPFL